MTALATESTFIRRSIIHSIRTPDVLVTAIALPVLLMLMFTFVFGGAFESDGHYVDYVVPGIVLLCAGFGAASTAVDVAQDMTTGIIDRFRTMPIRASAVITGHVVSSLLRNLVATAIVVLVGVAVGFRPNATPLEWVGAFGLIALYILAITYLFAAIGLAASSPEAASGFGFIIMFVPYLSSAFVPVSTMPSWLQWIAGHQPLTPIIETIRSLLMGTSMGDNGWLALGWIALILVGAVIWTTLLFRAKARRR
ncbi:MAG: Transport permease protein [Microbacteriaceae bacterium]|nr:Transport permease protein [Microbacteriaceae bacterium]